MGDPKGSLLGTFPFVFFIDSGLTHMVLTMQKLFLNNKKFILFYTHQFDDITKKASIDHVDKLFIIFINLKVISRTSFFT